jgi:cell division inhibitor SepF
MNIFQRMWGSIGMGDQYDDGGYDYEYEEEMPQEFYNSNPAYPSDQRPAPMNNVVGMPNRNLGHTEMCLMEPRSFEEMPQAVMALRERKSIILNLALMDGDTAQRCVDFVAGAAFAVDGHQERLGEHIFLFTPSFVQISSYPSGMAAAPNMAGATRSPAPPPTQINPPTPSWSVERPRRVQ